VGVLQDRDVGERIPGDDGEVGELAFLDRPEFVLAAETFGSPTGCRPQRLEGRHPGLYEAFDLERVLRVTVAAGIGAGGDLRPRGERPAQALDMALLQMMRPLANMRQ